MRALAFGRFIAKRFVPGLSFLDPCFGAFPGRLILVPKRFLRLFRPGILVYRG